MVSWFIYNLSCWTCLPSLCLAGTVLGSTGLQHQGVCSGQGLISMEGGCEKEEWEEWQRSDLSVAAESGLDKRQQRINGNTWLPCSVFPRIFFSLSGPLFAGHNLVLPFVSVLPPLIKRHENRIFHLAEGQEGVQLRLLSPTQLCTAGHTQLHHSCSLCSILWVGSTCTAQGRPF